MENRVLENRVKLGEIRVSISLPTAIFIQKNRKLYIVQAPEMFRRTLEVFFEVNEVGG